MKKFTLIIFIIVFISSAGCIEKRKTENLKPKESIKQNNSSYEHSAYKDVQTERTLVYSINSTLPDYKFVFVYDSAGISITNIKIYMGNDTTLKQIINLSEDSWGGAYVQNVEKCFFVEDYNYDSYNDIRLLRDWGSGGDFYSAWIFNPHSKKFVTSDFYLDLSNPTFNYKKKQLQIFEREGYGEETTKIYKFTSGKYILIKEDKNFIEEDSNNRYYVNELWKRTKGEMHLISRSKIQETNK